MGRDTPERSAVYDWAVYNSVFDPYTFAVFNEEYHGDREELGERARAWQDKHYREHRSRLMEERDELQRRIDLISTSIESNETWEFTT